MLKRAQLTDEGIVFRQSKTGAGVLVEWTDELRKITDRAKALKPQVPVNTLGNTTVELTRLTDSPIWQRLMDKATKPGKDKAAPVLGERFTFHDLRARSAPTTVGLEDAATLLGHASSQTTKSIYRRKMPRATPLR